MTLPRWFLPYALGCAVLAAVAPLAAYTLSLALFGAWHVHTELGWVRERFRGRLAPLVVPLLTISALRVAAWLDRAPSWAVAAELGLGVVLVAMVVPHLAGWRVRLVAVGVAALLGLGITLAPMVALVVFGLVHNYTPLGFFADRGMRMRGPVVLFVGLPLGAAALPALTSVDPLGVGPLAAHLKVFVPSGVPAGLAPALFTAAVVGQLLHYGAVIGVIGRWRTDRPAFVEGLGVAVAVGLAAYFASAFGDARKLYGAASAIHAWIEFPVLLLAFGAAAHQVSQPPTNAEVALAQKETASAARGRKSSE